MTSPQPGPLPAPPLCRSIFERAAAYVGTDWHAHALWDKYIGFEAGLSNHAAVAALYTRLLALPLRDLDRYHRE